MPLAVSPRLIRLLRAAAVWLVLTVAYAADPWSQNDLARFFLPDRTTLAVLSPDGRRLAYTVREDRTLRLVISDLDTPELHLAAFVETERRRIFFRRTVTLLPTLPYVQWIDDRRIVYLVTRPVETTGYDEELRIVDCDGRNPRTLLTSQDVEAVYSPPTPAGAESTPPTIVVPRRMQPIGLVVDQAGVVAVAALGNTRIETTVFRVDVNSGRHTDDEAVDGAGRLLFDHGAHPRIRETPRLIAPTSGPRMRGAGGMSMGREDPLIEPQDFLLTAAGRERWRSLDAVVRENPPPQFRYRDASFFGPRTIPLGFARDPDVLYVASNVGRDTFGVYAVDLRTGHRTDFAVERNDFDVVDPSAVFAEQSLVLDRDFRLLGVRLAGGARGTAWSDPRMNEWQLQLDALMLHRNVTILGWSDDRSRVLALATGPTEPGRYFVCTAGSPIRLTEVLRRTSIDANKIAHAERFSASTADGTLISGAITYPDHPLVNPPPLVLMCGDFAQHPAGLSFDRRAQALAGLGFLVVQPDLRGSGGLGALHRDAVRDGFARAPVADLHATLDWLAAHIPYDRRRVALVGEGFGGYVALRAVELHPALFRCVVTINGPVDPERWLAPSAWSAGRSFATAPASIVRRYEYFSPKMNSADAPSLLRSASALTSPLLILENPRAARAVHGEALRDALSRAGREVEYHPIGTTDADEAQNEADVYRQVVGFLNTHLYQFRVDVGREKEVP